MSLSNYKAESHEFVLKGGSFSVEGLSLEHVSVLVREHLPDIEALFELFQTTENIGGADLEPVIKAVISQAPGFAANVIALASGEPGSAPVAAKLPFPVQVEALMKIGDMTFNEVGGIKKSLELVTALLAKNKPMLTKMTGKAE